MKYYRLVCPLSTDIVQMHIETLDAVHRESKRLPPIQKVTNSYFYIPLDKGPSAAPTAQAHSVPAGTSVHRGAAECDPQHEHRMTFGSCLCLVFVMETCGAFKLKGAETGLCEDMG